MYLLDTNVVSEARRRSRVAVDWLRTVDQGALYLSVITLGEIMRGVAMKRTSDPEGASQLAAWLASLRNDFADRILPITSAIAIEWGHLAASRSRGDADGLIAATAIVHELTVVTRNVGDFADLPVSLLNPWGTCAPS